MRILFCDLCDESVPQADLDVGRAVRRKGRIVCATCDAAMSVERADEGQTLGAASSELEELDVPTPQPTSAQQELANRETQRVPAFRGGDAGLARRGTSAAVGVSLALASVALVFSAAAGGFLFQELRDREAALSQVVDRDRLRSEDRIAEVERRVNASLQAALAEWSFAQNRIEGLETRSGEQVDELAGVREQLGGMRAELAAARVFLEDAGGPGADAEQVERQFAGLREQLAVLEDRLRALEAASLVAARRSATPADDPTPASTAPAWLPLTAGLTSENSSNRWQAVQSLGGTKDPATAEFLIPMLKDPDIFVRMATARILGDLDASIAIPALIDTLADAEASVREAAVVSLRSIAGRSFKFDPGAKLAERERRLRSWREWWRKAAPEYQAQ